MDIDRTNTPDELLDLVDENDEVIGTITKAKANSNTQTIHREIRIILHDQEGRILLQQRSPKKKVYPGVWAESCQGHVPCGMSYEEAAHKELVEELGFDTDLEYLGKTLIEFPNETHFAAWYIGEYRGEEIKLEPEEVVNIQFIGKDDLVYLEKEMIPSSWQMLQEV
ncbi:MAG: NUDIX hydrolase [Patescibacteria group bacterium]|jgi:isopentenyl-diphosphate delta-isomerase